WDYPDGQWDAERDTCEFVSAMPDWRAHGLLSFTVNLQGGSPFGYSDDLNRPQPWINSAFSADGDLRPDHMARLRLVLDRADELVERVQDRSRGRIASPAGRFLVSMSFGGIPPKELLSHADFILLHGNDIRGPNEVRRLIEQCRTAEGFRGQPILFNEDDHFDLSDPDNKMLAAVDSHA